MNKTIIINISGIVFHIEEEAYEVLRAYMIDVKKHFGHSADSHEIVGDIENRIAEMFNEKIVAGTKEVINMADVHEVIEQMGRVSEFEDGASSSSDQHTYYEEVHESVPRKFMRDPDDRVFGGVASGIGHYFGLEARWIRLIFILAFLLGGSGLLLYIILWVIVPVARTRADRMAMRGEKATIRNFKRSFDEEMEGVRANFTAAGGSARTAVRSAGNFIARAFVILVKVIGIVFILALCTALIVLLVSIVASFGYLGSGHEMAMFSYHVIPAAYFETWLISALVVAVIPLVALIGLTLRILFNRAVIGKYTSFILLAVWLLAVGMTTYYGVATFKDFREISRVVEEHPLVPQPVYHLVMNDNEIIRLDSNLEKDQRQGYIQRRASSRKLMGAAAPADLYLQKKGLRMEIALIDTLQTPKLVYEYSARGEDYEIASERAGAMEHHWEQQGDTLIIDNMFGIGAQNLFRGQELRIKLLLPVGTELYIHEDMRRLLTNVPLRQCGRNYEARVGYVPAETKWIMTPAGLKCSVEAPLEEETNF